MYTLLSRSYPCCLALLAGVALLAANPAAAATRSVPRNEPHEIRVRAAGPRTGDDVQVRARFHAPSGRSVDVAGYSDRGALKVRFTPEELGAYVYTVDADAGLGLRRVAEGRFESVPSDKPGFVRTSRADPRRLAFADGRVFLPLGENRFNVYDPNWNYDHMSIEDYVAYMARNGMNTLRIFVFNDCHREEFEPGPQPGCIEPAVGRFDPAAVRNFDRIFAAAERNGIYVVLSAYAVGFTPDETWKSWEDNPYNAKNGGLVATPQEFFTNAETKAMARKRLQFLAARYAASPSLLSIDLLNEPEWDGGIPEPVWIPWAREMADAWRQADPYGHPVMTGSVGLHWNIGGDERPWWSDSRCDIVQWHLYGPEIYDVHDLAKEMTRKVKETWNHGKPTLVGEFGYGGEDKSTYDHTHVGIWTASFAGAGVLSHSAPPFELNSDTPMPPDRARHFVALSRYLGELDWSRPLAPGEASVSVEGARTWTLERDDFRAIWVMGPQQGYGEPVKGARVTVADLPAGTYRVRWFDDLTGETVASTQVLSTGGAATVVAPPFVRHVAAIVDREPSRLPRAGVRASRRNAPPA